MKEFLIIIVIVIIISNTTMIIKNLYLKVNTSAMTKSPLNMINSNC